MILVQITDPHLSVEAGELWGGYEPDFAFAAVLEAVARLVPQPDLVLFTGDLTETGAPAEYANFLRLAGALPLRKAAIPGNHDRHAAFATALADTDVAIGTLPRLHLVIDDLPLRVIALDWSRTVNCAGGSTRPTSTGSPPSSTLRRSGRRRSSCTTRPSPTAFPSPTGKSAGARTGSAPCSPGILR